jgi:hypothetical protein
MERKPVGITAPYREPSPEDDEFNRIERESRIRKESIRNIKQPTREQLIAEVAILTELVKVLSSRVDELEKKP